MANIFRWQHKEDGSGPYRGKYCSESLILRHSNPSTHPNLEHDFFSGEEIDIAYEKRYAFGFVSIEQMNNWFSHKEQEMLITEGFELVCYETEEYFVTEKQAVFNIKALV